VLAAGGKGANQAVAAARLGAQVTLLAKVGDDLFGQQAIAGYQREGIATDWVLRDPAAATGVALIIVDDRGENLIAVASGANHALLPDDVERAAAAIRAANLLVLQLEIPLATVEAAAALAAAAGVPVLLDPAPAPDAPLPRSLLQHVACIKPNQTEAERLTGIAVSDEASARAAAEKLLAEGVGSVIVTLGAKGCLVVSRPGEATLVPAYPVEAVDSTAAGDAFSGALACGLARGESLLAAAQFASTAAALSVMRLGAQPSLPTAEEVRRVAAIA
jgi:ribokinase